jgi:hypothetical protein
MATLSNPEQRARLAPPMKATGIHFALGDIVGGISSTKRSPGESKKGLPCGGISCAEISDFGEQDTDRIPALDVTGLSPRI